MNFNPKLCSGLSDKEIIQLTLDNIDYFACVFLKYEKKLLRYVAKLSDCQLVEAEDILQEAFIKIWKNLRGYDNNLLFENWIYRIVHNEAISHWRKKARHNKYLATSEGPILNLETSEDADSSVEADENYKDIEVFLPHLEEKFREVLLLKYFENKSYDEISDILKIPEGTVATRINRAKKAMKKLISK